MWKKKNAYFFINVRREKINECLEGMLKVDSNILNFKMYS